MQKFLVNRAQEIAVTFVIMSVWRAMKQIASYVRHQNRPTPQN